MKDFEKLHSDMLRLEDRVYRLENEGSAGGSARDRDYNALDRVDRRKSSPDISLTFQS
jgi:hypothetical protein